ncbi:MAG: hypothetical protein EXR76_16310 [Myxococcales bacterium]|nr:hypothetical protein [Myxococcales bacterium]
MVIDLWSRRVIGWSVADHMRIELVLDAFEMAVGQRVPEPNLIHHSDRGSQLRQRRLPSGAHGPRHIVQHESQGRLLGQRLRGELLRHPSRRS